MALFWVKLFLTSRLTRLGVLILPYCLECQGNVSTDFNQLYLYLAVTNEEERLPEMKGYYHIGCFLRILKKSKFRDMIETEIVYKIL